ncbi:unnamed protein product, partial [Cylicostephanus goldi]
MVSDRISGRSISIPIILLFAERNDEEKTSEKEGQENFSLNVISAYVVRNDASSIAKYSQNCGDAEKNCLSVAARLCARARGIYWDDANWENITDMDVEWQHRCKAYRFVAYSAVAFSVVAILGAATTLPMVYNYVHHVRRTMHTELNFCRASAQDIWSEVNGMKITGNRTARHAFRKASRAGRQTYGGEDEGVTGGGGTGIGGGRTGGGGGGGGSTDYGGNDCTACCSGGAAGPPGVPGNPGRP